MTHAFEVRINTSEDGRGPDTLLGYFFDKESGQAAVNDEKATNDRLVDFIRPIRIFDGLAEYRDFRDGTVALQAKNLLSAAQLEALREAFRTGKL